MYDRSTSKIYPILIEQQIDQTVANIALLLTELIRSVSTSTVLTLLTVSATAQIHPSIYITDHQKTDLLLRMERDRKVADYISSLKVKVKPYVQRYETEPAWITSRLQMYWNTKYQRVYVNGMDFSHGEGEAPVPTVRFSGSRDWDTDYLVPDIADILPYMDSTKGLYLQNGVKPGKPWEWVHPAETGHVIEKINKKILDLAQDASFLFWLFGDTTYAAFAADILMIYLEGMYHRDPPQTVGNHHNADLMGLQTFEVIHEGVIKPITLSYDFLFSYLKEKNKDLELIQKVFKKWAEQEIKYGVPGNNWNLMQARYITYLALALESDEYYEDAKGQEYYIDQVLNQNSKKQKALRDVMKNFDPTTGIWPEVASYSIMVSDDIIEVFCLMDKTLDNHLLAKYPLLEKAILANFNYLFPNGFTTAYGDAKHARLRFRALELLIAQHRKYGQSKKEELISQQLKSFMLDGAYDRDDLKSLFQLFFYVENLANVPPAESFADMVNPSFYAPNVSWIVQRNGNGQENGMMVSKNGSLGNHSHANGINLELYAKGMVIAPDCAAGVSYWSDDHREYYSRFPAHNTVVVDGISDYRTMNSTHAFELNSMYPPASASSLMADFTYSEVTFLEPATQSLQHRLTGTVRTSESSGYFVDIFRSARKDGNDKKHEYIFHGQGTDLKVKGFSGKNLEMHPTDELSSKKGDLVGYDYFEDKQEVVTTGHWVASFLTAVSIEKQVMTNVWMKGDLGRRVFTAKAPPSRAVHLQSVPAELYREEIPTLIVRQEGEAQTRPFVAVINASRESDEIKVSDITYFDAQVGDPNFMGMCVESRNGRRDFIYNHKDPLAMVQFADGSFSGTYGIVSYLEDDVHALFLGHGSLLEKNHYKIECENVQGSVWVELEEGVVIVDSEKPFALTMPVDPLVKYQSLIYAEGSEGLQQIDAVFIEQDDHQMMQFKIPACQNKQWKMSE